MKRALRFFVWSSLAAGCAAPLVVAQSLANARYTIEPLADGAVRVVTKDAGAWVFRGDFVVLRAATDPEPAMRPAGVPRVQYNVITWKATGAEPRRGAAKAGSVRSGGQAGDGFDDRILQGDTQARTPDVFAAAPAVRMRATRAAAAGREVRFEFAEQRDFQLSASVALPDDDGEPVLRFTLEPRTAGYFSVGYVGAPACAAEEADEIWQPFIWTEKRFPHASFVTAAFQCPVPATLVRRGATTLGVVADADEFPFEPLPVLTNSRYAVALREQDGRARPMVFAPLLGGAESKRAAGAAFSFKLRLFAARADIPGAYEQIARRLCGLRDFRRNALCPLNETLDNMIDYGMSEWSWFIEELKGCSYSTDVPGAVKNVSSLNPLNLALVADDPEIFRRRAYPIVEFLLSREKFLFSLDRNQKNQSPSRALLGPCAPVSELAALAGLTHGASPVLRMLAERELGRTRVLNLDDAVAGDSWPNLTEMFLATREPRYLAAARAGADKFLREQGETLASDFSASALFFWVGWAPKWQNFLQLYEATGERRYLDAAHRGARRYAMFCWMGPRVPDAEVPVNAGGRAPVYWYLQSKGHAPMRAAEERVPAWRLSEIGLTPESSGTMAGHRGIFMAHHAPWMLRIAALTGDTFLHDVARAAVVGRYRNFPGYHLNTARTTIYEKADYPLRPFKELSVNSFHYNHIWPHMSLVLDYLVTDFFARSRGAIDFPSRYIEGYAYLQSKFYGDRPGKFFGRDDAVLWLPPRLLKTTGTVELNHLAARGRSGLYLAFANQSPEPVTAEVTFNPAVLPQLKDKVYRVNEVGASEAMFRRDVRVGNNVRRLARESIASDLKNGVMTVSVPPMGLTAFEIEGLTVAPKFQDALVATKPTDAWRRDYLELEWGGARAMVLNFGTVATTAFIYLRDDDARFKDVTLTYLDGRAEKVMVDAAFPFEFTVPLAPDAQALRFRLSGTTVDGRTVQADWAALER
ncbi:MAG: hypothetical protein HZA93_12955 [Verrucomicrobia bacterium]|nr:hypothetical protein [Verrucomicrobiota bacterium]